MQNATILIVDDEPPILDLIASYLRAESFNVYTAQDGAAALTQARAVRPELVVLDVMLPGMDGLEVCRRLQQEFDVYILMLTARSEEIDKIVGLSVGADDYLTKPFSPMELLARLQRLIKKPS
jgi:two-component system alkaline phosphatase synthesis response regulator PhoP